MHMLFGKVHVHSFNTASYEPRHEKICHRGLDQVRHKHVEQSSFIQIVDMNRFFTGNPVSVRLIDYRKKS